jgi:ABC-type antimicrobial peptide transport system permease subunit
VYEPLRPGGTINFAVRARGDVQQLANDVRTALARLDPAVPVVDFQSQRALIDRRLRTERMLAFLSAAFGVVALTLVAVGLAGMLSYAVARRTNEIGVRMALGAAVGDVIRLVLRDSAWMLGAGMIAGLPCAYATARALKANLFNLEPLDPTTTVFAVAAMTLISLLAAWIPARRAARIDPMKALRND